MKFLHCSALLLFLTAVSIGPLPAQSGRPAAVPGPRSGGGVLLPNGWTITPAGKQIELSTFPMSMALSPDEKHLLVLNAGYRPPSVSVIDLETQQQIQQAPVEDGWLGLAFHPEGDRVFVGGGSEAAVFEFRFEDGKLSPGRRFPAVPKEDRVDADYVGDVLVSPDGEFLYAANVFRNRVTILNADTGFIVGEMRTGRRPYRLLMGLDNKSLLVSHWADSSIGLYDLSERRLLEKVAVGRHPSDMVLQRGRVEPETEEQEALPIVARLYVACANANSVWVVGMTENQRFYQHERIMVGPTSRAPLGTTPSALALSENGRLYTVCSGNNALVAADVSQPRAELLGAIPTGWHPTDAVVTSEGGLFYLNGKGDGSFPLPNGPDPTSRAPDEQYLPEKLTGSLGILPPLRGRQILTFTDLVVSNMPYSDERLQDPGVPEESPIPNGRADSSPIKHVIYVIKENRTYDQVLGDLEQGRGDPDLTVFGREVTPNHHKLAEEFVLFDNFYTNGSVSAGGQNWSVAALANDFVQKLWPSYQGRRRRTYDFEGGEPLGFPPAGFLWNNALAAGLSVRNYGMWAEQVDGGPVVVLDPALGPHTNMDYVPFNLKYPDGKRVDEFLKDFKARVEAENLPRLMIVRLPGDHTAGRAAGYPTARAMMAEHDYAFGRLVEEVSRSPVWEETAIFAVEDDAQDGADHIDAHRSLAFVISPWARRGFVDSTHYSTASVLRTMELILGMRPMTQFDASATPMHRAFTLEMDASAYEAVRPEVDFDETNPDGAGGPPRRVEGGKPESKQAQSLADAGRGRSDSL